MTLPMAHLDDALHTEQQQLEIGQFPGVNSFLGKIDATMAASSPKLDGGNQGLMMINVDLDGSRQNLVIATEHPTNDPFIERSSSSSRSDAYPAFSSQHATDHLDNYGQERVASITSGATLSPDHGFMNQLGGAFAPPEEWRRLPRNVSDALADLEEKTSFIIVPNPKVETSFVRHGRDPYQTPPPKPQGRVQGRKPRHRQYVYASYHHPSNPTEGTCFTPVMKEVKRFDFAYNVGLSRCEPLGVGSNKVIRFTFSEEDAQYIRENCCSNDGPPILYQIEVVSGFDRDEGAALYHGPPVQVLVPAASTEFTGFPNLPTELQLEIWKQALPSARIVPLYVSGHHPTKDDLAPGPGNLVNRCRLSLDPNEKLPIHPILQTCSLSRRLARAHMLPAFPNAEVKDLSGAYTYFNPKLDTLQLTLSGARRIAKILDKNIAEHRELVRHVRIDFPIFYGVEMFLSMADLIRHAPHRSWPSVQSWDFPGMPRAGNDKEQKIDMTEGWTKEVINLAVKRPTKEDTEDHIKVDQLAAQIIDLFAKAREKIEEPANEVTRIGIKIVYT